MQSGQNLEVSEAELKDVIEDLTGKVFLLEQQFLKTHKKNKNISSEDSHKYHMEIKKIADRLEMIMGHFFERVKSGSMYEKINNASEDFNLYGYAISNLTSLIILDILSQKKVSLVLMAAERWAFIMKSCFEKNNFMACYAIFQALNGNKISDDEINILKRLSSNAQGFLAYLTIFRRQPMIHNIQLEKAGKNELMIPLLTSLHHIFEMLSNDDEEKKRYSANYERIFTPIITPDIQDEKCIAAFAKLPNQKLLNNYDKIKSKIKKAKISIKNTESLTKNLVLYANYDIYYQCAHTFNLMTDNITQNIAFSQKNFGNEENKFFSEVSGLLKNSKASIETKHDSLSQLLKSDTNGFDKDILTSLQNAHIQIQKVIALNNERPKPPVVVNIISNSPKEEANLASSKKNESKKDTLRKSYGSRRHKHSTRKISPININEADKQPIPMEMKGEEIPQTLLPVLGLDEQPIEIVTNIHIVDITADNQPENMDVNIIESKEIIANDENDSIQTHDATEIKLATSTDSVKFKREKYLELIKSPSTKSNETKQELDELSKSKSVKKIKLLYSNLCSQENELKSQSNENLSPDLQALLSASGSVKSKVDKYHQEASLQTQTLATSHRGRRPSVSNLGIFKTPSASSVNEKSEEKKENSLSNSRSSK